MKQNYHSLFIFLQKNVEMVEHFVQTNFVSMHV